MLVVSYTFPPHGGVSVFRTVKFLKYLPEYGWTPSVLTASRDAQFEPVAHEFRDDVRGVTEIRPVQPLGGTLTTRVQRRLLSDSSPSFNLLALRWILPVVQAGIRVIDTHDIDIVYYTAPPFPQLLAAPLLKRMTGLPYIVDLRDPWSIHPYTSGGVTDVFRTALADIFEPTVLRNAARVCCVTEPMTRRYVAAYPELEDTFETITNGFDPDEFDTDEDETRESRERIDGPVTIAYAGKFSSYRDPEPFVTALRALLDDGQDVRFVHFGRPENRLVNLVTELDLESIVRFAGYVDRDELVAELSQTDLGLVVSGGDETELTTKVFDYIGCNLPILAVGQQTGALVDVVSAFENGYICANRADAIQETIRQILDQQPPTLGDDRTRATFSRKRLTRTLATVLETAAATGVDEYQ
ncbi:hypothetical protein B2G88_06525 [Natronolimnobius baerhuensis]|uniref:Glycosyltransferase subfamily 4-like N-terminal domain-containing protein n=1 Tax=Natronolimnobius baerhuensis TaxID=253108 RepID=A0A202E7A9_9EURY|nr:hypothetical protein B2G88_06525 [Natronolimnobius baerhuensis]